VGPNEIPEFGAGSSAWPGEWSGSGFIAAVLLLNVVIGTAQEHSAERRRCGAW
jgi:hypothetical protein